jgi:hypothetical protein
MQAGRIIRFEDRGNAVIGIDEDGNRFIAPRGSFDWQPLVETSAPAVIAKPPPRSLAGRRLSIRRS